MKQTLWTREFTRITAATALGAAGGIISQLPYRFWSLMKPAARWQRRWWSPSS